jgi:endonuclease/exonuclease/phosphatase family metal-dependent hydrolase
MLKLFSWNIQSARGTSGATDIGHVIERIRAAGAPDVLLLQEVASGFPARDGSEGGDQFAALQARLPDYRAVSADALETYDDAGRPRRMGSMILTRFPIVQVLRHALPWPADSEVPSMPRLALEATLETPLGLLRAVSVHLEYFSERQRLAQIDRLRELHVEAAAHARAPRRHLDGPFAALPRPASTILAGDFNMEPHTPSHQRMLAPLPDDAPALLDAWQVLRGDAPHAPTVGLNDPNPDAKPFTFDFAFISADLAPRLRRLRVLEGVNGSDHQPLLLELE